MRTAHSHLWTDFISKLLETESHWNLVNQGSIWKHVMVVKTISEGPEPTIISWKLNSSTSSISSQSPEVPSLSSLSWKALLYCRISVTRSSENIEKHLFQLLEHKVESSIKQRMNKRNSKEGEKLGEQKTHFISSWMHVFILDLY